MTETRLAGLFQTFDVPTVARPKAVLEQPSPRAVGGETLGRRNIVLVQSTELN